ncbi:hypothetical protein [Maribacter arenosus]|uniref:Lipoprotein n=1 Tax=Maribacter arenosus TaxID=1854708 RepID=A0ABR7VG84_9FLAO|nr:hypothetical protein [Maribacter arenosus]MBD0852649.1 hypothetical protein [Maribacter arenosus]
MNKLLLIFIITLTVSLQSCAQSTYENITYSYQAKIPSDWNLAGEIKNDTIQNFSIVEWTLPKVISESKENEIQNSIEIYAWRNSEIKNINELINHEKQKWQPFLLKTDILQEDSEFSREVITTSKIPSFDHKSKKYFIYKNGICYRIQLVCTQDTFDKNLSDFENFYMEFKIVENKKE